MVVNVACYFSAKSLVGAFSFIVDTEVLSEQCCAVGALHVISIPIVETVLLLFCVTKRLNPKRVVLLTQSHTVCHWKPGFKGPFFT